MRFFTDPHRYYCGIDLHARTMYLCILDGDSGEILLHRNVRCEPERFLHAIEPYRDDLVVRVECIFCWYWLADLCAQEDIPFVLGHALYMKAIHGGKAKNDRVDAHKIATLLRGGAFPMAYVYPRGMRATRDLMRRRLFFVRRRSELFTHIRLTFHQLNLPAPSGPLLEQRNRATLAQILPDSISRANVGFAPSVLGTEAVDETLACGVDDGVPAGQSPAPRLSTSPGCQVPITLMTSSAS